MTDQIKPEGDTPKETSDDTSAAHWQSEADKRAQELTDYRKETTVKLEEFAKVEKLFSDNEGLTAHVQEFLNPKPKADPNFDASVDYDPTEAITNKDSESGKAFNTAVQAKVDETMEKYGITKDTAAHVQEFKQEQVDEALVRDLMQGEAKMSMDQAVNFLTNFRKDPEKFILGDLAQAYSGKANLKDVRETQEQRPSVAGVQGTAPDETTDNDKAWASLMGGISPYKEKYRST